jgi:hypothetical protein
LKILNKMLFVSLFLGAFNANSAIPDVYQTHCRESDGKLECTIVIQGSPDNKLNGDGCVLGNNFILQANADSEYAVEEWNTTVYIKTLDIKKVLAKGVSSSGDLFIKGNDCTDNISYYEKKILNETELSVLLTNDSIISKSNIVESIAIKAKKSKKTISPILSFKGFEYLINDTKKYVEVSVASNTSWHDNNIETFARYLLLIENGEKSLIWSWIRTDKLLWDINEKAKVHGIYRINGDIYYYLSNEIGNHDEFFEFEIAEP